ncbi:MAG: hypothetical protein LBD05_02120 [Mycoplasmataceae bacterium]|nr:hypothetical protein [Mycoplasmataceae bacterium]
MGKKIKIIKFDVNYCEDENERIWNINEIVNEIEENNSIFYYGDEKNIAIIVHSENGEYIKFSSDGSTIHDTNFINKKQPLKILKYKINIAIITSIVLFFSSMLAIFILSINKFNFIPKIDSYFEQSKEKDCYIGEQLTIKCDASNIMNIDWKIEGLIDGIDSSLSVDKLNLYLTNDFVESTDDAITLTVYAINSNMQSNCIGLVFHYQTRPI